MPEWRIIIRIIRKNISLNASWYNPHKNLGQGFSAVPVSAQARGEDSRPLQMMEDAHSPSVHA
jgi:hypothetical protein